MNLLFPFSLCSFGYALKESISRVFVCEEKAFVHDLVDFLVSLTNLPYLGLEQLFFFLACDIDPNIRFSL